MDRVDALGTVTQGQTVQALAIGYDRVGNVASITDAAHAGGPLAATRTFGYDDLYRLRTAGGRGRAAGRTTSTPAATGRRSPDLGGVLVRGASRTSRRRVGAGASGYVFDEAGQLTARPGSKQTYDAKGRLTSVTLDDGTVVTYRYDYAGMVAVKETTGPRGHHRTVYADKLAEERDGELVDYVFAARAAHRARRRRAPRPGRRRNDAPAAGHGRHRLCFTLLLVADRLRCSGRRTGAECPALAALGPRAPDVRRRLRRRRPAAAAPSVTGAVYYHHDHLGGVVLETDEHGAVVREASFDPYGGDLQRAADEPYAFTGKERDPAHRPLRLRRPRLRPEAGALPLARSRAPRRSRARRRRPTAPLDLRLHPQQPHQPHRPGRPPAPHPRRRAHWSAADRRGLLSRQGREQRQLLLEEVWRPRLPGRSCCGAIAAATGGASLFVQGAVSSVGGGIVSRAIETGSVSQTFSPKAILTDAVIGGTSSVVLGKVGAVVAPKVVGVAKTVISRAKDAVASRAAARVVARGGPLRFTQTTASPMFSAGGRFAGKSISEVAGGLRSGALRPSDVPVEIIVRNGNRLIVNTRSSLALRQAGIPEAEWNLINRTGVPEVEANIFERLARNKLGDEGSEVLRITGAGANASTYRKP